MKIDVDKYKEEDISNISKEDTPIVRALDKRQTRSFIAAFVMILLVGSVTYFHAEIGHTVAAVLAVLLTIGIIVFGVYSVMVGIKLDRIKKWQKNELYKSIREQKND